WPSWGSTSWSPPSEGEASRASLDHCGQGSLWLGGQTHDRVGDTRQDGPAAGWTDHLRGTEGSGEERRGSSDRRSQPTEAARVRGRGPVVCLSRGRVGRATLIERWAGPATSVLLG